MVSLNHHTEGNSLSSASRLERRDSEIPSHGRHDEELGFFAVRFLRSLAFLFAPFGVFVSVSPTESESLLADRTTGSPAKVDAFRKPPLSL